MKSSVLVNALSGLRLAASVLILVIIVRDWSLLMATLLVVYVYVSDWLDGMLARRWYVVSKFGYLLDGVADRASYISMLMCAMLIVGAPPEAALLLIIRDLSLYAYRAFVDEWYGKAVKGRLISKLYAVFMKSIILFYWVLIVAGADSDSQWVHVTNILLWLQVIFGYASLYVVIRGSRGAS